MMAAACIFEISVPKKRKPDFTRPSPDQAVFHSHGADSYIQNKETAESGSGPQTRTNLQAFLILQYVLSKVCFSCYTDLIGV